MFHLLTGADPQSYPLLIFDFQKNPRPRQINSALSDQMEKILCAPSNITRRLVSLPPPNCEEFWKEHWTIENRQSHVRYQRNACLRSGWKISRCSAAFAGSELWRPTMFCAFCGSRQPLSQKGVHAEIYAPSAATARLISFRH
jgi:serine/threonine-protein kinase